MEAPTKMARDKGVLYRYPDGTEIFVKGREHKSVTIQVKNVLKSHKTLEDRGGLHKDAFRSSLVEDASYLLGERNGLSGYLDYIAQNFDEDRAKGEELGAENYPEAFTVAGYVLTGGGGFGYRKNGDKNTIPLTNFTAKIVADTDLDGGPSTEPKREYTVEAWLGNKPLGKHRVDATRFDNMAWVPLKLGSQARVVPGYGNAAKAADAIKCYSDDTEITKVFTHTGYREVDGEMVYLHEGLESPEVRLSTALSSHYRLPTDPTPQEILEGIALSYELWNLAPEEVSIPITAAAYTAPLATTLNTDFVIYVYGPTGVLKTTKAALVGSHFGNFTPDNMALNFESTSNFLERALYDTKDSLAIVDDLRPGQGTRDKETLEQRLQKLARVVGNHVGRGRMMSNLENRESFVCRSMVMATGEYLPSNATFLSATARMLSVKIEAGMISLDDVKRINRQRSKLAAAMAGFTKWLSTRLDTVEDLREELHEEFSELGGAHLRLPQTMSKLLTGVVLFGQYAVEAGAITEDEARVRKEMAKKALVQAGMRHGDSLSANSPARRFLDEVHSGLVSGRLYVCSRKTEGHPTGWTRYGWREREKGDNEVEITPAPGAKFVGWMDEDSFYFEPQSATSALERELGGLDKSMIGSALLDKGYLASADKKRDTKVVRVGEGRTNSHPQRVWMIRRSAVDGPL